MLRTGEAVPALPAFGAPSLDGRAAAESVEALAQAAIVLSLAVVWMLLLVAGLRSGLADATGMQLALVPWMLLPVWLPVAAVAAGGRTTGEACATGVLALLAGVLGPLAGLVIGRAATVLAAVALGLVVLRVWRDLPPIGWRRCLRLVGAGFCLAAVLLACSRPDRFFLPENLALGLADADNHFHVALSQMALHFGVPSTGGDGVLLQRYHFGSHILAAAWAKSVGAPVATVYVYWVAVALKVLLLMATVWCGVMLTPHRDQEFPGLVRLAWAGLFLVASGSFAESPSFLLAVALFLAVWPLAVALAGRHDLASPGYRAGLALLVIAAWLCAVCKVSLGFFAGVVLVWVLVHGRANRANVAAGLLSMVALAACTALFLTPQELGLAELGGDHLWQSYRQYLSPLTLASYLLPLLIVAMACTTWRARRGDGRAALALHITWAGLRSGNPGRAVALLALCTLVCVALLLTLPIGSNMAYFSGVLFLLSAALLPLRLYDGRLFRSTSPLVAGVLLVLTLSVVWQVYDFRQALAEEVSRLLKASNSVHRDEDLDDPDFTRRTLLQSLAQDGTLFGGTQAERQQDPWRGVLQAMQAPVAGGARLMVYAPPSATSFWNRLRGKIPYWCLAAHLMVPAQTGIPMVLGIRPLLEGPRCVPVGVEWYGFGKDQDRHRSVALSDAALCQRVLQASFDTVYVVHSITTPADNRVLKCRPPATP